MYCGRCGTKLKNDKCPKCEKAETKKVVKAVKEEKKETKVTNNGDSFGWAVLGFFVPIVGLILFFVFMNTNKKRSKLLGIGAIVGFSTKVIVYIVYYIASFIGLYSGIMGFYNEYINEPIYNYGINNYGTYNYGNNNFKFDIETIKLEDIDTDKKLTKKDFKLNSFTQIYGGKEYTIGTEYYKVSLDGNKLVFKDGSDVIKEIDNVDMAFYYEMDCSNMDVIIIRSNNKDYYINGLSDTIEFKEVKGNYDKYYVVNNHSLTCGASTLILGKDSNGDLYDLNGEVGIETDNLYYYDDSENWIGINRNYKIANNYGSAKLVVMSSVEESLNAVVDVYGYAYEYTYSEDGSEFSLIENSPVKEVKNDTHNSVVKLIFENGKEYTFDYSTVDY